MIGLRRERQRIKALYCAVLAVVMATASFAQAQPATKPAADRERLIGAWHLAHIDAPAPEGKSVSIPQPLGMLVYTRDGHVSVQLMYPKSANAPSNEYVQNGYEASFGSYEIDEATHTLTHHVQGSVTRDRLVGKDLPRRYSFTKDGHLIIASANPEEHWSVTWEHY